MENEPGRKRSGSVSFADALPRRAFVETAFIRGIVERALSYLHCGLSVHFCGPAGTGKTTLALQVAHRLGRPLIFVQGDNDFTTADLIGGIYGYRRKRVIDNYVRSVLKTAEDIQERWTDNRLTVACRNGYTFLYDEFTRSRPETNNVLLSVLEEGILTLPPPWGMDGYIDVHPDFRAVFTSNPEEYAGIHPTQDALRDRMVTIRLNNYDEETEVAITSARSGLAPEKALALVRILRWLKDRLDPSTMPGLRSYIKLARFVAGSGMDPDPADPVFRESVIDVVAPLTIEARKRLSALLTDMLDESRGPVEQALEFGEEIPRTGLTG